MWKSTVGGVGTFVAVKGIFVAALAAVVGAFPLAQLTNFDALWYLGIVEHGYDSAGQSNLAFFPLLPGLTRIPILLGVSPEWALLIVAWLGSIAAVVGIQRVGAELGSAAVGFWLAFFWAVAPRSHVQVMGYAEGWFTAFVAWGLWAMLTRRPWLAGFMGLLAGLTRAPSVVFIAVLWLWWVVGLFDGRGGRGWKNRLSADRLGAALLGSSGFVLYWLYVAYRTGSFTGYLEVQERWNSSMGSPVTNLVTVWKVFAGQIDGANWSAHGTGAVAIALAIVMLLVLIYMREHWLMIVSLGLAMVLVLMQQEYFNSKARMLMPWFMMWLPLARLFGRVSAWVMVPVAVALVVGSTLWGIDGATYQFSP